MKTKQIWISASALSLDAISPRGNLTSGKRQPRRGVPHENGCREDRGGRQIPQTGSACASPRLTAIQQRLREFSFRLTTSRYVFYGALLLAGSLVGGALTRVDEVWWRTAASLGIATVLIGFIHAWLDARAAREDLRASHERRSKKS